jgi:hypothetical protein
VASALVARDGRQSTTEPLIVCTSEARLFPTVQLAPYGEVHVVDEVEATALAAGCAHAGDHELTPSCELWRTRPVPTVAQRLTEDTCATWRAAVPQTR